MYTAAKRRVREAEKRVERLHYKFINDYVKNLHHNIYKDAENLYNTIRQKYPDGVKDLTKTVEYMEVVTPGKTVPRYYMSRKTTETTTEMEMVLRIPLIQHDGKNTKTQDVAFPQDVASPPPTASFPQDVASPPPTASFPQDVALPVLPEKVYQDLLQELQKDSDLMEILNNSPLDGGFFSPPTASFPQDVASPPPTASFPQDVALPVLPEKVYQDLLQELQIDSDLMEILNNSPLDGGFSCKDTTTDVNDIWESIMPDDMSPLEDELRNVFMC